MNDQPQPGLNETMQAVYGEMKRLAAVHMSSERPGHTLQPTALVHEVYLRLLDQRKVDWQNRAQVLGIAAQMMRRILLDYASGRNAAKRWGTLLQVPLDSDMCITGIDITLLDLDRALCELEKVDERQARVVELRFYGGLTAEETAEAMQISLTTVQREWATARLWLLRHVREAPRP